MNSSDSEDGKARYPFELPAPRTSPTPAPSLTLVCETIAGCNTDEVMALLLGVAEPARRPLAKPLLALARQLDESYATLEVVDGEPIVRDGDRGRRIVRGRFPMHVNLEQSRALAFAILAVASLDQLKRRWDARHLRPDRAFAILADRRPGWLQGWVEHLLADPERENWQLVRALVRSGLVARPDSPEYIESLLAAPRLRFGKIPVPTLVEGDPDLLEHEVWRFFELDGGDFNLTTTDREDAWSLALRERLPRERLLDRSLAVLTHDWGAYKNRWFIKLHTALEPTLEERLAFAPRYAEQLHSPFEDTAGWALDQLDALDREHPLDAALLVDGLRATATSTRKRVVLKTLAMLARIAKRDPVHASECAAAVAEALVHESADVQARALKLLTKLPPVPEAVARHRETIAATNREALAALLAAGDAPKPAVAGAPELDALAERIAALSPRAREALQLDAALAAAHAGTVLPLPPPPADEPRLDVPIDPVASLDELGDLLLVLMAGWPPDMLELERALDAISRFCVDATPFDGPLAPVRTQLNGPHGLLGLVVWAWITGDPPDDTGRHPYRVRLHELAVRAARREPGPLLALPTHRGGWLDARILAERVAGRPVDPGSPDAVAAYLRLAPEHRAAAPPIPPDTPAGIAAALGPPEPRVALERAKYGRRYRRHLWPTAPVAGPSWAPWRRLAGEQQRGYASDHVHEDWLGLLWPAGRDLVHADTLKVTPWYHRGGDLSDVLLGRREPVTPLAARLIGERFGSDGAPERMLATDIAVAAIETGRLDAPLLAGGLEFAVRERLYPLNRATDALQAIAAVSTLHAETVRATLERLLAFDVPQRDLHHLLTLLNELSAAAGARVAYEPARAVLAGLTGSSKAAKAAKALLARDGETRLPSAALALEARISRAERWTASTPR